MDTQDIEDTVEWYLHVKLKELKVRREELCKSTAYPDSNSVHQALLQVWNEMQQDFNSRTCSNCKFLQENSTCSEVYIFDATDVMEIYWLPPKEFGCNKFESKDK